MTPDRIDQLARAFPRLDYHIAADLIRCVINEERRDERKASVRLHWLVTHRHFRVQGSDEHGWCVLGCSDGLTFLVDAAKTYEDAIDQARKIKP